MDFLRSVEARFDRAKVETMRPEIQQVVELIRRKDPQSLDKALALLQKTVFSFSMRVCGHRQDAEDTMQEVLLKSVPNLSKFDNPKALMVWLYKVAKNRCLMNRRRSRFAPKNDLSLDELMPDRRELHELASHADATPESSLLRRESAMRLREVVKKLPTEHRIVLVLHDMEGLTDEDIAEITGLRSGTVRVRLHRARLFVRKELARDGRHALRHRATKSTERIHLPAQLHQGRCKEMFAELSNYLDDELDDSLCAELEKHMEGCQPCQAFLCTLERSIQQCRMAPDESFDPRVGAKLRRELMAEYQQLMATVANSRGSETKEV